MKKLITLLKQQMAYQKLLSYKSEIKGINNLLSAIANFQNQLKSQRKNFKQNEEFKQQVRVTIMQILSKALK